MSWFTHHVGSFILYTLIAATVVYAGPIVLIGQATLLQEAAVEAAVISGAVIAAKQQVDDRNSTWEDSTPTKIQNTNDPMDDDAFDSPGFDPDCVIIPDAIADEAFETASETSSSMSETMTETLTETNRNSPHTQGDYAGIQKTMYNPVTSEVIGLKMHARTVRSRIGGSAMSALSKVIRAHKRGDYLRSAKMTHHSPVRPHGHIWDSAFRP